MAPGLLASELVGVGVVFLTIWLSRRRVYRRLPWAIVQAIQTPGVRYQIKLPPSGGIWNPAHSSVLDFGLVFGGGTATYWTDEASVVHLVIHTDDGHEQHLTGPLPAQYLTGKPFENLRGPARRVWLFQSTFAVGGFLAGYLLSSKNQVVWGLVDAAAGFFAGYYVVLGRAMSSFVAAHHRRPGTADPG